MPIHSTDPRTGETRATFQPLTDSEIDRKLEAATRAFVAWRRSELVDRSAALSRVAERLVGERASLARIVTEEMGKTIVSAEAEVDKCARACRYYAENLEWMLADEAVATEALSSYVRYLPLGPVLAVMPWNFPLWQVVRFAAPALAAGNVALLKHASNVPRSALALEDVFRRSGLPEGAFQALLVGSAEVPRLLEDRRVAAATFTGSTAAGAAVASCAGKVVKPTVLELGGSDAFVVMPSADLDAAVKCAVASRTLNNGQSCINAKRFIVHRGVYDAFLDRMVAAFEGLRVGDPMDRETDIGPLALAQVRDDVARQVDAAVRAGARRLTGGARIERGGYWFRPGVIDHIPERAPAYREEVFGPVAMLFRVEHLDHAIRLANDSDFGLGSSVWTREPSEERRLIDEIEAGQTFVNAMVASDPRLPFGGVKQSGYGRELGVAGVRSFVNAKSVSVGRG